MSEQFTEIKTITWAERLKNSLKSVILGVILFLISFPLLVWNEGRFIDRAKVIEEGLNSVISISSDQVLEENQGALIHITGIAKTDEILKDELFGIEVNAIKLQRKVEMYQWSERSETKTKKEHAGTETQETTYTYDKVWSENWIDSSNFKIKEGHENPKPQFNSKITYAKNVKVRAFQLTDSFIMKISATQNINISKELINKIDPTLRANFAVVNDTFYNGNPQTPEIGDVRVSFIITPSTEVSAIGKQKANSLQIYRTKDGEIDILMDGTFDALSMFKKEEKDNIFLSWLLRFLSLLMMWIGLNLAISPFTTVLEKIPFLGDLLNSGILVFTFIISVVLSLITVGLSWLFFKPFFGLGLLVIVGIISFSAVKMSKIK